MNHFYLRPSLITVLLSVISCVVISLLQPEGCLHLTLAYSSSITVPHASAPTGGEGYASRAILSLLSCAGTLLLGSQTC